MAYPLEQRRRRSATPELSAEDAEKIIARQQAKKDTSVPAPADELVAILAQHVVVGHVFLEIAVGPEMAEAMLARNFDNRPLRESKAKIMAQAMIEKRYADAQPHPICFDIRGILGDGQHRLRAVVISGCTIIFTVCFGCHPKERDYYDQGTPRSVSDIAREHGHAQSVLAQSVVALILRVERGDASPLDRTLQTERLDELFSGQEFELSLKAGGQTRKLIAPATGSLAFYHIASHTAHRDRLDGFWENVAKGTMLPEHHPAHRVRNQLLAEKNQKSSRDNAVKKAGAIVLAWNAHVERRRPRNFKWEGTLRLPEVV